MNRSNTIKNEGMRVRARKGDERKSHGSRSDPFLCASKESEMGRERERTRNVTHKELSFTAPFVLFFFLRQCEICVRVTCARLCQKVIEKADEWASEHANKMEGGSKRLVFAQQTKKDNVYWFICSFLGRQDASTACTHTYTSLTIPRKDTHAALRPHSHSASFFPCDPLSFCFLFLIEFVFKHRIN